MDRVLDLGFRTDRRTSDVEFASDDGEESSGRGDEAANGRTVDRVHEDPNQVRSSQNGSAGVDVVPARQTKFV